MTAITEQQKVVHGVVLRPRKILSPKVTVSVKTPLERQKVIIAARRVINTHRDVLEALRDR